MSCLLVIAHPLNDSLCRSLAAVAQESLTRRGLSATIEDLYADGFSPALSRDERLAHYGTGALTLTPEMERLRDVEVLVLVFPTWWFGFPAILKGWFDRVWAPGIAYDHAAEGKPISARLVGLKTVIAITTLGSPRWVDWLVLRQPVKRVLKRAIVGTCAPQATFIYLALHDAENVTPARFENFAAKIRRAIAGIA